MKKDLEKLNKINSELSRLLKIFRGTLSYVNMRGISSSDASAFFEGN